MGTLKRPGSTHGMEAFKKHSKIISRKNAVNLSEFHLDDPKKLSDLNSACFKAGTNDIHVWQIGVDTLSPGAKSMEKLISNDERMRAGRFHFAQDRKGFVMRRGMLRLLLGLYLDMDPKRLEFAIGRFGKPSISKPESGVLNFNMSHSDGQVLYAMTLDRHLGVDIERIRPLSDFEQIVSRYYSKKENIEFNSLSPSQKCLAFFNGWTRKEAYLKARGVGLHGSMKDFTVSLSPEVPAKLLSVDNDRMEKNRWHLFDLNCPSGYVAALCMG